MREGKAIEVGNIFPLKTRFSDAFDLTYAAEDGSRKKVLMGCYGIGPSRVMGTVVEVHHDDKGIIWPKGLAPFLVHLVTIHSKSEASRKLVDASAWTIERELEAAGIEILVDDREASAGEKFADADLIGCPLRLVVSEKTLAADGVEWKERSKSEAGSVGLGDLKAMIVQWAKV
jgi:prolyl-tRNA synthetase